VKKILNKLTVIALSGILCLGATACNNTNVPETKLEVWTAYGTEKILRDVDYSSRYNQDVLTIKAFREENESAQIILSTKGKVNSYTLTLSDLTDGNGNVLSKNAFTVYNQKYINVTDIKDAESQTGAGYYPDALLPYDVAVEHGENNINDGLNQGLWITLKTTEDQPAGTYTGKFQIIADGKTYQVPVSVTVYDFNLTETVHSKSSFLINAEELALGELDCTTEMIESYHDFFLDHRISPNHLSSGDLYGVLQGEELENFLTVAEKSALDPRCSNYHITYAMSGTDIQEDGKTISIQTVDFDLFESTLRAMADRSIEKGVNLFKKAATYFVFFDEYDVNGKTSTANYNLTRADQLCQALAEELRDSYPYADLDFKMQLLDDLANIRHKCVGSLTSNLTSKATMVPTIDKYHTAEGRKTYTDWAKSWYGDKAELWTYTCMNPDPPYPTYHTEDVLISSRLLSWMMYNYNITGNLYWSTTLYAYSDGAVTGGQIQDYYDKALRFPQANGDGYLVYPGRPYGIKGPVGTVRLKSILDGNEDYDLLWQLENQLYAQRGVTGEQFDSVLKYLVSNLYNGTKCNTDKEICSILTNAREQLANLLVLADKAGVVIENAVAGNGKIKFTVSAPNGVTLTANGTALTNGTEDNGIKTYDFEVSLDQASNALNLLAQKDDKTYNLNLSLGGRMTESQFGTFSDEVTVRTDGAIKQVTTFEDINAVKLSIGATELSTQINVSDFAINDTVKTITLKIYADSKMTLDLRAKCEKHSAFVSVTEIDLVQGWNEIVIDVYTLNCSMNGNLNDLRLTFNGTSNVSVTLGMLTVVGAGR